MSVRIFVATFVIVFLFRSSAILPTLNYIQTVFLFLFGSKGSVSKHNIFHEDAEIPGNLYSGTINGDKFYRGNMNDGKFYRGTINGDKFYRGNINDGKFYRGNINDDDDDDDHHHHKGGDWNLFSYIGFWGQVLQHVYELAVIVLVIAPLLFIVCFDQREGHRQSCTKWKTIGKLRVSGTEIAKGSNGTVVFEGTYEGRKVAVKRLVKAHHDVAYTEIQNLIASDQHPNIVRWYGSEDDHDFVYLSLERCDCSLNDLILNKMYSESFQLWRPNDYPYPILLKLMRDIVAGLAHLHDLGIIHRDLKPHNVLIVKGKGLCVKISDMGISRLLVGDVSSVTSHTIGSGSSGWQAPEQLCLGRQTRAVDLFSLGCVLFFCMTHGGHPFGDHLERDINVTKNKVNLFLVERIPEAVDLFSRLLNRIPELRPKASEVLYHPLFWNSETRMSFLSDTSNWVESEGHRGGSIALIALESEGRVALCGKWNLKLEAAFISHMRRFRHYKYNSVRCLLRLIRNTLSHYRELPKEIQKLLGSVPNGSNDYFRSKFPRLLMEVYNVMYHHCKQEDWFRKYLEN